MESILIKPKNKREFAFLREFFKKINTDIYYYAPPSEESLESKIFNLYEKGHYSDVEIKTFFSIPKKYRIDPFKIIDDGDIYYADQRNIKKLKKDLAQGRDDLENGKTTRINTQNIWASIL